VIRKNRRFKAIKISAMTPAAIVITHTGRVLRKGREARLGVIIEPPR
jgi:hypothetical protein